MSGPANIFCFYGPEDFLVEEELSILRAKTAEAGGCDPGLEYFSPDSAVITDLIGNICTPSLFGGSRIIVLEGFEDEDYILLLDNRKSFPHSVKIVIMKDKLDKRGKLYKLLASDSVMKEFNHFAEWETKKVVDWIISRAKKAGKNIDPADAELLNDISGPSLRQLACEIEKLSVYIADGNTIRSDDIRALAVSGELGAFALENAFADRDLGSAIKSLAGAFRSKQQPQVLIGRIASRLRPYLMIKALQAKKMSGDKIISMLGMNPYFYERCNKGAALYSLEELVSAVGILSRTDLLIKNSSSSPRIALEMAIVDIMGGR